MQVLMSTCVEILQVVREPLPALNYSAVCTDCICKPLKVLAFLIYELLITTAAPSLMLRSPFV